ncbi:MAG TPA: RNA-binding domain-containing protein, partial [Acidimicrobiales bacterium]|nr:RNA-binding domain-containing protein [Acidimicrobiales bacterium]
GETLLLLDGQQRLTSLYVLFEGEPPPFYEGEALFPDLYFNLQTEEFRFWQRSLMAGNPQWIDVHHLLHHGADRVLEHLDEMTELEAHLVRANLGRLRRLDSLRDYRYRTDVLAGRDLHLGEVVEIFNEVNAEGTRLARADLALARVCVVWPEAREVLRGFASAMADRGFGVDLTFLLRALAAVAGGSVLLEAGLHHVPAEALQLAWSKVTTAFERLVDVVRREAYVDSLGDLPSPLVLLPITVHLANHDASFSTDAEKARFLRWLFLAGVWGRYSASTESTLQRDVALLAGPDPPLALERAILAERGRLELEASDVAGKGAGSAVDKLAVVVARARGARDWFSGEALHDGARAPATGLEGHHIFPKTVLYRSGYDPRRDRGMVNEVANRVVLAPGASRRVPAAEPVAYLAEVDAAVPGALEAQSVPLDRRLWEVESYGRFLAERARLLAAHMNEFLALLAPFDRASTGGSRVADLVAGGEGATVEFKASLRWGVPEGGVNRALEQSVVKAVAGFLNSREGGTILIGVADDGMVLGLAGDYASSPALGDRDGFERHLRNLLSSAMGEAVHGFVAVTFHDLGGRDLCQVTVRPSDRPVYVQDRGVSAFYLRTGNATSPLPVDEVVAYYRSRWG